eukprot:2122201-Amphidinium_carterae.1
MGVNAPANLLTLAITIHVCIVITVPPKLVTYRSFFGSRHFALCHMLQPFFPKSSELLLTRLHDRIDEEEFFSARAVDELTSTANSEEQGGPLVYPLCTLRVGSTRLCRCLQNLSGNLWLESEVTKDVVRYSVLGAFSTGVS